MAPFIVGRESSVRALEQALQAPQKRIFLVAQKDPKVDEPLRDDIYEMGVVATVIQNLKLPNGNVKVMVEGVQRGKIARDRRTATARSTPRSRPTTSSTRCREKLAGLHEQGAGHLRAVRQDVPPPGLRGPDVDPQARRSRPLRRHPGGAPHGDHGREAVAARAAQSLRAPAAPARPARVEIEKINIDKRINVQVKKQMEKAQKEYYLNEKIKAIHQELGRKDDRGDELAELKEKIEKAGLPKEVKEKADQELKRLEAMPPVSAEATVSRNYIDWLVAVPWKEDARSCKDLKQGRGDPQRGPLRPGEDQGAHPRVPGRAPAGTAGEAEPRSSASSALRASASPRSPSRSPARPAASSCACRWAACATRPRSAATAAPTSAPSRARSSR